MCTKLVAYVYQTSGLWVTTQQQVLVGMYEFLQEDE